MGKLTKFCLTVIYLAAVYVPIYFAHSFFSAIHSSIATWILVAGAVLLPISFTVVRAIWAK